MITEGGTGEKKRTEW